MTPVLVALIWASTGLTALNSFVIWRLSQANHHRFDKVLAALLSAVGEKQAATYVATGAPAKVDPGTPPHMTPRQIGISGR